MSGGIWLEVSRVRIEREDVWVQLVGDKRDDGPKWWRVKAGALGAVEAQKIYHAIATGLDKSDQVVIARLGPISASTLRCNLIRIQTT